MESGEEKEMLGTRQNNRKTNKQNSVWKSQKLMYLSIDRRELAKEYQFATKQW